MGLTTFLVLSLVMAIAVGLLASFLLRAWLKKPPHEEDADKTSDQDS